MRKRFVLLSVIFMFIACSRFEQESETTVTTTKSTTNSVITTTMSQTETFDSVLINKKDLIFDKATGTIVRYTGKDTDIIIPDAIDGIEVIVIGEYAFSQGQLQHVVLPDSLVEIQQSAFSSNELRGEIIIPSSVISIGDYAFHGNIEGRFNQISKLTFEENSSLKNIGQYAFSHNNLTSLQLPEGITQIGENAFASNVLTSFNIPKTVEILGTGAFNRNSMTGDEAFLYYRDKNGVNNKILIGFAGPRYTSNITIPSQVEEIGVAALGYLFFSGTLTIPKNVRVIGYESFSYNGFDKIVLEEDSKLEVIHKGAFGNNNFSEIVLPKNLKLIQAYSLPSTVKKIINRSSLTINDFVKNGIISSGRCEHIALTDPTKREGQFEVCSTVIDVVVE